MTILKSPKILLNFSYETSAMWDTAQRNYWDMICDFQMPELLCSDSKQDIEEKVDWIISKINYYKQRKKFGNARYFVYLQGQNIITFQVFYRLAHCVAFAFPVLADRQFLERADRVLWGHQCGWRILDPFAQIDDIELILNG